MPVKINLLLDNEADARSGYFNIGQYVTPNQAAGLWQGNIFQLEQLVDAGEADEVIAHDVLTRFAPAEISPVLDNWVSRLAHGGMLCVSVVDLKELSRGIMGGSVSLEDANILIHGPSHQLRRQSSFTMAKLVEFIESKGLTVVSKRYENYRAVVRARRP